ncbi:hypothetical protein CXG81DRAFT_28342 [Caulochytrium protostelioides]|uniref:alanine--glyoxylate transaminase n=1 Tax=Caulochytrium protostelioides TaxID=1555241 RepID=A0A4P9X1D5_9FUNG|nr:hypothetical protein CXG81DRAFT_28342 [Caulochytrium protostelioides]|eukprot:RKO98865.1 hypothetical protein CXG81DRAFT_28342 [Caulochytrium protostelioides]
MAGAHALCMIPGPVEFDGDVLAAMSTPATSHVAPAFLETFGRALEKLRVVFAAPSAQPFVFAGSGTLAWDATAANLLEPGDAVLVVNTGIFADWFGECLGVYGGDVTQLRSSGFGDRPALGQIEEALAAKSYKMIVITQVDTSSGVLNDVKTIAALVSRVSPDTLIVVDGVCSVGGEALQQEAWGVDVALTASQKALGVPPGLAVLMVSQRALKRALDRTAKPTAYFVSFKKWHPIMQKYEARQPSYFATPPVQLIMALDTSLTHLVAAQADGAAASRRWEEHVAASATVKDALEAFGLTLVPTHRDHAAHTLTAVYYPEGIDGPALLKAISERGVVVAGGLFPGKAGTYFRIGHMNISATRPDLHHLETTIKAVKEALTSLGYAFPSK